MTLTETIYQKGLTLPPEKAREVLDFIKDRPGVFSHFLTYRWKNTKPFTNLLAFTAKG